MMLSVYLPLLFTAAFGLAAPVLARRLPPAVATWLLAVMPRQVGQAADRR
jgi:hypothetical protein